MYTIYFFLKYEYCSDDFRCNDLIKNKDDTPTYLATRLAAIRVLGTMYGKLGRLTGRSYEDTVHTLIKGLKSAESLTRAETFYAFGKLNDLRKILLKASLYLHSKRCDNVFDLCFLGKVCTGLGTAATNVHRDIYKAAKASLSGDRALRVRSAAASCIVLMASHTSFLYEAPNGELLTVYRLFFTIGNLDVV